MPCRLLLDAPTILQSTEDYTSHAISCLVPVTYEPPGDILDVSIRRLGRMLNHKNHLILVTFSTYFILETSHYSINIARDYPPVTMQQCETFHWNKQWINSSLPSEWTSHSPLNPLQFIWLPECPGLCTIVNSCVKLRTMLSHLVAQSLTLCIH